ncbi:MAG TPA: hypothetical protein V6C88_11920 [Chroococcidiopsis sp.]
MISFANQSLMCALVKGFDRLAIAPEMLLIPVSRWEWADRVPIARGILSNCNVIQMAGG